MPNRVKLGKRKHPRTELGYRPGFVIVEPDGPGLECFVVDISEGGARLKVGALALPKTFVLVLTANGKVKRACELVWRKGDLAGARFISGKELASAFQPPAVMSRR